ncbi:hypothetical protein LVJ94_33870 [Pendulispora rubella]|uniref:FAD-binding domain-containing protein n=1 Tax=Pendulispora rubella TaxID=2741070 RepID=A0ABZ2KTP8_9BACT
MPSPNASGRAIIIGASLAGLAAARVLLDHFDEVVLLDRDRLPEGADFRIGVPQGRQYHVLLKGGELLYESLFPGLSQSLVARGAPTLHWGTDVRWHHTGGWKRQHPRGVTTFSCSRPLLESEVRARVRSDARVRILDRTTVRALVCDPTRGRALGVRIERRPDEGPPSNDVLEGALIVDASGRESKAPAWLAALGASTPEEVHVDASMGYASRLYRPPAARPAWKGLILHPTPPDRRQGSIFPNESGLWHVTLSGYAGDHPPTDEEGFLRFAASLDAPDLHEALRDATPLSPIHGYRRTENRLRRYDRLRRPLEGFIVLGDAVCALNPIYGHGMSTAAMAATVLASELRRHARGPLAPGFAKSFYAQQGKALQIPWMAATVADAPYTQMSVGGFTRFVHRFALGYSARLARLSVHDTAAFEALLHVGHLLRAPSSLFHPFIVLRALGLLGRPPQLEKAPVEA